MLSVAILKKFSHFLLIYRSKFRFYFNSFLLSLIIINKSKMYYNPRSPKQNPNQTDQLSPNMKRQPEYVFQ